MKCVASHPPETDCYITRLREEDAVCLDGPLGLTKTWGLDCAVSLGYNSSEKNFSVSSAGSSVSILLSTLMPIFDCSWMICKREFLTDE